MFWEEAQECCDDEEDWRRSVVPCVFDTGRTSDQVWRLCAWFVSRVGCSDKRMRLMM